MAVADGVLANPTAAVRGGTFADMVQDSPQPIPEVVVPFRAPKLVYGDLCVVFSKEEIENSIAPFRFSLVLKFLRQHPSLDEAIVVIQEGSSSGSKENLEMVNVGNMEMGPSEKKKTM